MMRMIYFFGCRAHDNWGFDYHLGQIGSVEGHEVVDHEQLLHHGPMVFFTKTISKIILRSKQRPLDGDSRVFYYFYVTYTVVLLIFKIASWHRFWMRRPVFLRIMNVLRNMTTILCKMVWTTEGHCGFSYVSLWITDWCFVRLHSQIKGKTFQRWRGHTSCVKVAKCGHESYSRSWSKTWHIMDKYMTIFQANKIFESNHSEDSLMNRWSGVQHDVNMF